MGTNIPHQVLGFWKLPFAIIVVLHVLQLIPGGCAQRAPTQGNSQVKSVAVNEHNKYRKLHGAPALRGDDNIHRDAQKYAEYLASNNLFTHSGNKKYGENLAGSVEKTKAAAVRDAVKRWYDEVKFYDYNRPVYNSKTGHFTAVVWKSTTHVGIGVAWNPKKNMYVVVANYSPPGNFGGRFKENVPPRG